MPHIFVVAALLHIRKPCWLKSTPLAQPQALCPTMSAHLTILPLPLSSLVFQLSHEHSTGGYPDHIVVIIS